MVGEPPYSPAVPDDLENAPSPPPAPVPSGSSGSAPPPNISLLEEMDIAGEVAAQERIESSAESIPLAHLGGLIAAVLAVAVAAGLVTLTGWWHGSVVILLGFGVACVVKQCGRGSDRRFGLAGAGWALLGCFLANQAGIAGVFARLEGMALLDYLRGIHDWTGWLADVMRWPDLLFYAAATFCGYRFSFDSVPGKS